MICQFAVLEHKEIAHEYGSRKNKRCSWSKARNASEPGCHGRGLSSGGSAIHLDATAPRKYNLTFVVVALNLVNVVNLGTPNGVLDSRIFGQAQSLASGPFGNPTPGNRAILFQANFSF